MSCCRRCTQDSKKCRQLCRGKRETQSSVSPYFLSALGASKTFYNTTAQSQGYCICFTIKNPLSSSRITFEYPKQTLISKPKIERLQLQLCVLNSHNAQMSRKIDHRPILHAELSEIVKFHKDSSQSNSQQSFLREKYDVGVRSTMPFPSVQIVRTAQRDM